MFYFLVLDPRYKLKYLDFCHKKIYEPKEAAKVMNWVETQLRKLFEEYILK